METVNWKDMNVGQGAPLIDPGFYLVEIKDFEKKTASTGTEQVLIKGTIAEGELQGTPVQDYLALTAGALWRVGAFVQASGHDLKGLPNMILGSEEFFRVLMSCKGRTMFWDIGQDTTPQGKIRNKVNAFTIHEEGQEPLIYEDNVPSFIKNKGMSQPPASVKAAVKKAGLI